MQYALIKMFESCTFSLSRTSNYKKASASGGLPELLALRCANLKHATAVSI